MGAKAIMLQMIDIAVNLQDNQFKGIYNGKQVHDPDIDSVIERAKCAGVERIIITGTSLKESKEAINLNHYATVGCHPTNAKELSPGYMEDLLEVSKAKNVVAIGECGLDYDRLNYCPADIQKECFISHFPLARKTNLPMFLHSRNTGGEMYNILCKHRSDFSTGVVHSFTGTIEEVHQFSSLGLYISINGCSMRTPENIAAMKAIPINKLLIETDAPWCSIRPTHPSFVHRVYSGAKPAHQNPLYTFPDFVYASSKKFTPNMMVRGRCEPAMLLHVLAAAAALRGEDVNQLAATVYQNTLNLFF